MVVMILERVPPSLRGELTRWMLEPHTGTFVGTMSALVRDKLWELVCDKVQEGAAICIYSSNNEQGFEIRTFGETRRKVVDFEGLKLIKMAKL